MQQRTLVASGMPQVSLAGGSLEEPFGTRFIYPDEGYLTALKAAWPEWQSGETLHPATHINFPCVWDGLDVCNDHYDDYAYQDTGASMVRSRCKTTKFKNSASSSGARRGVSRSPCASPTPTAPRG